MVLVKVPAINGLGKTIGCEDAPDFLCNFLCDNCERIEKIEVIKADNKNIAETQKKIYNTSKRFFKKNKEGEFILFLGGDHSISFPIFRALSYIHSINIHPINKKDKKNKKSINKNTGLGLVVFDAHADCMPPMKEPTHEEWLRALIEKKFVNPKNIIIIGLRKVEPEEMKFLKEKKIKYFFIKDFIEDFDKSANLIIEEARKFGSFYLSIDIDVIDPAFAPGTGYREAGGFSSKDFFYLIKKLAELKNLRAADLVEINPKKDINNKTIKLGAKIISIFSDPKTKS